MKKSLFLFYFCFVQTSVFAQQSVVVKGEVVNEKRKPVEGVSLIIHPAGEVNSILRYAISDTEGAFQIKLPKQRSDLAITAMSLSYADKTIKITDFTKPIVLQLTAEVRKLKEVVVKARNIRMRGDTITYTVGAFAKEKDRSIGEVIGRMPGFEVTSSGAIEYQGKRIEKYYIEGLDLLEGRYSLANNNLPHKAVASVEVLENHQPIKMLDSLVFSDKTSLNIRLKNRIAVTGTSKLGLGVSPLFWDANLTPMFFSKKQQAIASYQTNNIGDDVGKQLQRLSFSLGGVQFQDSKKELLSVLGVAVPNIGKNRYLDNNVHLLTYNHLVKLKKNTELKINTSYLNDYQQQRGNETVDYIQGRDTLHIAEQIYKIDFTNYLKTDFIVNQNLKERYLKNKLGIQKYWDSEMSELTGTNRSSQRAKTPYFSIGNNLEWIQPFRNKFLKIGSEIHYEKAPQRLQISPSVFERILSEGQEKRSVVQFWNERNFTTEHSLQFSLNKGRWSFDSEVGLNTENTKKTTYLEIDEIILEQDSLKNDLNWFFTKAYLEEKVRYETNSFFLRLGLPFSWEAYNISDKANERKKQNLLFQPTVNVTHKITPLWTWNASASYRKSNSGAKSLYYGYILHSYRNISRRNLPLSITESWSSGLGVKYKNPISGFFASVQYWQVCRKKEAITQLQLNADGSTQYRMFNKDNATSSNSLMVKTSKIVSPWRTTFFLSANYARQTNEILFNNQLLENTYRNYEITPKVSFGYFDWFTLDYKYSFSKGKQKSKIMESATRQEIHSLQGSFYHKSHSLTFTFEDYITKTKNENYATPFFDISYNFKWKDKRMDFSLKCINLLNKDEVRRYYLTTISEVVNTYQIRPRQVLLSVRMSFLGK